MRWWCKVKLQSAKGHKLATQLVHNVFFLSFLEQNNLLEIKTSTKNQRGPNPSHILTRDGKGPMYYNKQPKVLDC